MLTTATARVALVAAFVLQLIGLALFTKGFFPYKSILPGRSSFDDLPVGYERPEAQYDRLVFILVDALRRFVIQLDSITTHQQRLCLWK